MRVHEYVFDVKLFAAIKVKAQSESQARYWLDEHLSGGEANLGAWIEGPGIGEPILAEISQDGRADLVEVDGEAI